VTFHRGRDTEVRDRSIGVGVVDRGPLPRFNRIARESPEKFTSDPNPATVLVEQIWSMVGAETLVLLPHEVTIAYLVGCDEGWTGGTLVTTGR
jgi:hypothetical protein